jgi:hypothetical protein
MPTGSRRHLALTAVVALVFPLMSCNKGPTSPAPGVGPAGPVAVTNFKLVAPAAIAPGESVQLIANAIKSDGSVENVSRQVVWAIGSGTASSVLSLSDRGVATGGDRGEAVVTARFDDRSAEAIIFVLPKGTFRLAGIVSASNVGLENVTVTVTSGVAAGLTSVTDFYGHYFLYGVAGSVHVRASKDGYVDSTQQMTVAAHATHFIEMVTSRPTDGDFTGTYTLTITAGDGRAPCTSGFPEAAKRRVYTADVKQSGADLKVSLTGADFIVNERGRGNHFRGAVTPTGEISFWISPANPWDYDENDLVERLSDGSTLYVAGTITARSTAAGISGTVSPGAGGSISIGSSCPIDRFEMVRR